MSLNPVFLSSWGPLTLGSGARDPSPPAGRDSGKSLGSQCGWWEPEFLFPIYLQISCSCPSPA